MRISVLLPLSLILVSCGEKSLKKEKLSLKTTGTTSVVVMGADNVQEIRKEAKALGVNISGESILVIHGDTKKIEELEFVTTESFDYIQDEKIRFNNQEGFKPDKKALYLAKRDFGFDEFKNIFPKADGRGVKVGVIDDGISPNQKGFITTSTGERKFLKKGSQSSFTTFSLAGFIDESRPLFGDKLDLNENKIEDKINFSYIEDTKKVCIDLNINNQYEDSECKGSFSSTGEYFTLADGASTFLAEIDSEKKEIQLFLPEKGDDSHGEGVASVLAGYSIGGIEGFDGVAPGSQILDYDLSHPTDRPNEFEYSIGTFLNALEWNGVNGAEVVNISYSLFFSSAKAQTFMNKALSEVIKKYNMVVSFSAGNNGPGLGSLNRRAIYPSSALVAGAFISKELDEYVHGVTGIPDEGRVVYYSSRGPGLGIGPVLISPLSSLTNGTPNKSHMAFNGTSSASPALAGAAALLISALKQNNIAIDAETVVNALRLSGQQLKNEPFIFQGFGLPQLTKAYEIYKQLMDGSKFMAIEATSDSDSSDGVAHRGIFIRTSQKNDIVSSRITMSGSISKFVPAGERINMLAPVRIEYSKGITGASRLWVSSSQSRFFIDIDPSIVLNGKDEAFGEIRIISDLDNSLMAIVPVTVVNDEPLTKRIVRELSVGAQDGVRMHINVPEGVKGFRVNVETLDGEDKYARLSVFDPDQIRITQIPVGSDLWVNVTRPGYYQVGLAINGGTARKLSAKITVDTLNLLLRTKTVNALSPSIKIQNGGQSLAAKIRLNPAPVEIASAIFTSNQISSGFEMEQTLKEGSYFADLTLNETYDLSFEYISCTTRMTLPDGTITWGNESVYVPASGAKVNFRCMPFDKGVQFAEVMSWTLKILSQGIPQEKRLDMMRRSTVDVLFDSIKPGSYLVELEDPFNGDLVSLGTIEAK